MHKCFWLLSICGQNMHFILLKPSLLNFGGIQVLEILLLFSWNFLPSPSIGLECRHTVSNACLRSQVRGPAVPRFKHAVLVVGYRSSMCIHVSIKSIVAGSIRSPVMLFVIRFETSVSFSSWACFLVSLTSHTVST